LIQQGGEFTKQIKPTYYQFPAYFIGEKIEYEDWKAKVKRFLGVNYPNDKSIVEFETISSKDISPDNHSILLAILKAIKEFPQPNILPIDNISSDITINNNISQIQNIEIKTIFFESIKDELNGKQVKEIKEILEHYKNTPETAKTKIIDKLKNFGENILSNILANIITNPNVVSAILK